MKKFTLLSLISVASLMVLSSSSFAAVDSILSGNVPSAHIDSGSSQNLLCTSPRNSFGGSMSISISDASEYDATLKGFVNGGEAHFVMLIGPYNVKVSHEADVTVYSNDEEGVELDVVTTTVGSELRTTANFKNGIHSTTLMTCQVER